MIKKILLVALLAPSLAIAQQPPFVRNDNAASTLNGVNLRASSAAVDSTGKLTLGAVVPGTGATNLGKAEDSVATSGDVGVQTLGVRDDTAQTKAADGDYIPPSINLKGAQFVDMHTSWQASAALGLLKLEDAAAASGDALVGVAAVRNDNNATSKCDADSDYCALGVSATGALNTMVYGGSQGNSAAKLEDNPSAGNEALMSVGGIALSAITQSVGATGDYAPVSMDLGNRLITTLAPAGESWYSCGTATATTADVAIKAAVASNRIYVTSISCKNSSATVATTLDFKDGATDMAAGGITSLQATAPGSYYASFPVPLRGTVNTAFNFSTNISTSSVRCCAQGYISTI